MKKCWFSALFVITSFSINAQNSSNFKVIYRIDYVPEVNVVVSKTEFALLEIYGEGSLFSTENLLKQDSIKALLRDNKVSVQEVMNNRYPKTGFSSYVEKHYDEKSMKVLDKIVTNYYHYVQPNKLVWKIHSDTLIIQTLACQKATTTYEGRSYTAWYTTGIPIADGPYKFWGLPGLIVKIYDTEMQYVFTLQTFERKPLNKIPTMPSKTSLLEVSFDKFKALKKEASENPDQVLKQSGFELRSVNGDSPTKRTRRQLNTIEK